MKRLYALTNECLTYNEPVWWEDYCGTNVVSVTESAIEWRKI